MEWWIPEPHAYRLHSFITVDIRYSLRERIAANVKIFIKRAIFLRCAKDIFYDPNWSLYPKGLWIMQVSQVLTSHPHTAVQWKCSTERYSLQSRQGSGFPLEWPRSRRAGSGPSWLRNSSGPLLLSLPSQLPSSWPAYRGGSGRSSALFVLVSHWPSDATVCLLLKWAFRFGLGWWWPWKEHFLRLLWFSFK